MDVPLHAGLRPEGTVDVAVAARVARTWVAGGIVGLPTETVYGLSADAQNFDAVARVYRAKERPVDHPVIVHVAGPEAIEGWSAAPNEAAHRLAEVFWPGPLTLVIARGSRAGDFLTGGQDTVALRCPDHRVALACLAALVGQSRDPARGVAAPSANRFGRVSPTCAADVLDEVGARLDPARDLVVDGGPCAVGVESTIVDCTASPPRVLRLGAISQAQVDAALAGAAAGPEAGPVDGAAAPVRAPGTLDAHYAPRATVVLEAGPTLGAHDLDPTLVGLLAEVEVATPSGWTRLAAPRTVQEYARDLYAALRRADERGLATVVAVLPDAAQGPLAHAVADRLARAAHGR
ncbi:MAG: L-threonylcarbamoyladenylate synthase [Candidatus Nanopelagicales bacterium]